MERNKEKRQGYEGVDMKKRKEGRTLELALNVKRKTMREKRKMEGKKG